MPLEQNLAHQQTRPLPALTAATDSARLLRLYDVVRSLNSIIYLDQLLVRIVASAAEMMEASGGAVLLIDEDGLNLTFEAAAGGASAQLKGMKVPINERSIAGLVVVRGRPYVENNTIESPFFSGEIDKKTNYVTRKIVCVPLAVQERIIGVVEVLNKVSGDDFDEDDLRLLAALSDVAAVAIENVRLYEAEREKTRLLEQAYGALQKTHGATLKALAGVLDMRDDATHGHSNRVVAFTLKLAETMGIGDPVLLKSIAQGALLHDVGKIGVPDAILRKPGKLTDEEWIEMKKHPEMGYRLLMGIEFLQETLPTVRHHHEHWDGSGYPSGLRGEEIPLEARIFAVADAFDAITSERPYSAARTYEQAAAILREESGTTFDPRVIDAFMKVQPEEWTALRESVMHDLQYASRKDFREI
ncbi:MAG: HD domain-containing phosphohydrolase [Chloroflexota bacterium]